MIAALLESMSRHARRQGMTDRQWAQAAGLRHETLCRVRRRESCDAHTLEALARGCGLSIALRTDCGGSVGEEASFPASFTRETEERLLRLCALGDTTPERWRALGPGFFVAGVANLVASANGLDPDGRFARLAEALHPGVRSVPAFTHWLSRSPVRPGRFLPMLRHLLRQSRQVPN